MPRTTPIQNSFNAGEWSPQMAGRTDLAKYSAAAATIENFQIMPEGGLLRRSGTRFVRAAKFADKQARLQRFVFGDEQAYVFEMGEFYVRIYRDEGIILQQTLSGISAGGDVATVADEIQYIGHGYLDQDGPLQMSTDGTLPTGLSAGVDYYVASAPTTLFEADAAEIDIAIDEIIVAAGHGYSDDQGPFVVESTTTIPGGLDYETEYYIVLVSATNFGLSVGPAGAKIDITTIGAGTHTLRPVDSYTRDKFRLSLTAGGAAIDITGAGIGTHTLTPQDPIPIELVTPYTEGEVADLSVAQSADVMYICHKSHAPRKISRFSAHGFFIEEVPWVDGPYLNENVTDVTLAPAAVSGANVTLTASDAIFKGSDIGRPVRFRDSTVAGPDNDHWGYGIITSLVPVSFTDDDIEQHFWAFANVNVSGNLISTTTSHGLDTGELVHLKQSNTGLLPGGLLAKTDYYVRAHTAQELSFHTSSGDAVSDTDRIDITDQGTSNSNKVISSVIDIVLHGYDGGEGPLTLTTTGVLPTPLDEAKQYYVVRIDANSLSFAESAGGAPIGIDLADGPGLHSAHGGVTTATTCTISVKSDFNGTTASTSWRLGAWSSDPEVGYPRCISFHENRLWLAGNSGAAETAYASKSSDFETFSPTGTLAGGEITDLDDTVEDDNSIVYALASAENNVLLWLSSGKSLLAGSSSAVWSIQAAQQNNALSPTNIAANSNVQQGSSSAPAIRVGDRTVFVSATRRKIWSVGYSFQSDQYAATDVSLLSGHVGRLGFLGVDYSPEMHKTVFAYTTDGTLAGITIDRDQEVEAWARHRLGGGFVETWASYSNAIEDDSFQLGYFDMETDLVTGTRVRVKTSDLDDEGNTVALGILPTGVSANTDYWIRVEGGSVTLHTNRGGALQGHDQVDIEAGSGSGWWVLGASPHGFVESAAVIPATQGDVSSVGRANLRHDQVWLLAKRLINGETKRYVEFMEDFFEDNDLLENAYFVDCGLTYQGVASDTITGLDHIEDEVVSILANGRIESARVFGGSVTLSETATKAHIGLGFASNLRTMRMAIPGADGGTAETKLGRTDHVVLRFDASVGGLLGPDEGHLLDMLEFTVPDDPIFDEAVPIFTGDLEVELDGPYETYMEIYFRQQDPLPTTLLAIVSEVQKGGRGDRL